jgi:hypothetical protein
MVIEYSFRVAFNFDRLPRGLLQTPTRDELENLYRSMSEQELMDVAMEYDKLMDVAQTALRAEFATRKMEPPEIPEAQLESSLQKVAIVDRYRDLTQALLAKSALQSAGIASYLRDENTVRIEWVWSNLIGGIRLQVAATDLEEAQAILAQPIPETIALEGDLDFEQPRCPRCGSLDIIYETKNQQVGIASMYSGVPIIVNRDAWKCSDCGALWEDVPEE